MDPVLADCQRPGQCGHPRRTAGSQMFSFVSIGLAGPGGNQRDPCMLA